MSWISRFFGGGNSAVGGVSYPDYYSDPHFSGSQDFLDTYSKDLLNKGPNDYYKPIGEYGTPEFMNFLNQGNSGTLSGVDAALAKTGRARGGRVGEVAAQALGDNNAKLMYADYIRAMQGRKDFFNTGLDVQANVRDAGYANQDAKNAFNVGHSNFDLGKAAYQDDYKAQQDAKISRFIGGRFGDAEGGTSGSSVFTNSSSPSWIDSIMNNKKSSGSGSGSLPGVSSYGSIGSGSSGDMSQIIAKILPMLLTGGMA